MNCLPTSTRKFTFVALLRSKKNQIIAIISKNIGNDSSSMGLNLLGRRVVHKNERSRAQSTSYDNNVLRFGNN